MSNLLEEIYIEDGVPINLDWTFYYNSRLRKVRLPESPDITNFYCAVLRCPVLESIKIPRNVVNINGFTYGSMDCIPPHVVYDAENATIRGSDLFATVAASDVFDLEIGANVDTLPANFVSFVKRATSIKFHGENWLTVADGALSPWRMPLAELSGTVYVDDQGVIYTYDAEKKTAAVYYVQPGVPNVTIPRSIFTEDGLTECVITTVKQNALMDAGSLTSLTFLAPECITAIETLAMANCTTLTSVNGQTTVEGAEASFTNENRTMGYEPFYNTGLTGASGGGAFDAEMDGEKPLTVTRKDTEEKVTKMDIVLGSKGSTMTWVGQEDGPGGYRLLTNDTLTITGEAGNSDGNKIYVCAYRLNSASHHIL